uniref:DUF3486 family protein n=1 Tax=Heterorhabditis bacteriophora TaxID=37862 RepID=A0A1I7XA79_HETBA
MVVRILRSILNNEKVIQELAESAPIRAVARLIVRTAKTAEERVTGMKIGSKMDKLARTYQEEYKKALKK